MVSTTRTPRASRASSLYRSTPPKVINAARRASLGGIPRRSFFACSSSMWSCTSSASSRSTRSRRKIARSRRASRCRSVMNDSSFSRASRGRHHRVDRRREPAPRRRFRGELALACVREVVVLRLSIVFGGAPLRRDPASVLESMQCGVERALVHLQDVLRDLLDPLRHSPAMHRLEGKSFENQHVECPLQDVVGFDGHGQVSRCEWVELPYDVRQECTLSCRMSRGSLSSAVPNVAKL